MKDAFVRDINYHVGLGEKVIFCLYTWVVEIVPLQLNSPIYLGVPGMSKLK